MAKNLDIGEAGKITFLGKLRVVNVEDAQKIRDKMHKQTASKHTAFNRLLEGDLRNDLKKEHQELFGINSRYADDSIYDAQTLIDAIIAKGLDPEGTIFGGANIFSKLQSKTLSFEKRTELKEIYKDKRQHHLYSRGDHAKNGNPNIKLEIADDATLVLRINVGDDEWVTCPLDMDHRKIHQLYVAALLLYVPYTVRVFIRKSEYHVRITVDEHYPTVLLFTRWIGIDLNAYPAHIAWAKVKEDGNLLDFGTIPTPELFDQRSNKRDFIEWQIAHIVLDMAIVEKCGVALEFLKIPALIKGQKNKKTRRKVNNFCWKSLADKIEVLCKRAGVPVIRKPAYYSSVIGSIKYASQFNMSTHCGAAFVMARRALGFKEDVPKELRKLVEDHEEKELEKQKKKKANKRKKKEKLKRKKSLDSAVLTNNFNESVEKPMSQTSDVGLHSEAVRPQSFLDKEHRPQWKERMQRLWRKPLAVWKVVKAAVLTGQSAGGSKVRWSNLDPSTLRSLLFPSVKKKKVIQWGHSGNFPSPNGEGKLRENRSG